MVSMLYNRELARTTRAVSQIGPDLTGIEWELGDFGDMLY
jgi:hypothetical protein